MHFLRKACPLPSKAQGAGIMWIKCSQAPTFLRVLPSEPHRQRLTQSWLQHQHYKHFSQLEGCVAAKTLYQNSPRLHHFSCMHTRPAEEWDRRREVCLCVSCDGDQRICYRCELLIDEISSIIFLSSSSKRLPGNETKSVQRKLGI